MKKIFLLLFAIFASSAVCRAQFTQVTAQVLDPAGHPYQNCSGSANFVPAPNATTVPTIGGSVFNTVVNFNCDGNGNFQITLVDNNQVSDGHASGPASQWNFAISKTNICLPGQNAGFQVSLTITGPSQNITSALEAASAPLPVCGGGSPTLALQTNGVPNVPQNLLNLANGLNMTLTNSGGTTTVGTIPTVPVTTADTTWTSDFRMKGPIPFADLTAWGSAPSVISPGDNGSPVTCTSGSAVVSATTNGFTGNWQNGMGATLANCGPLWNNTGGAQPTCPAPTVTPSNAEAPTRSHIVTNSATGMSTYSYILVCRDKYGALTAPSAATTITNGLSSLGLQNATVTAASRSNDTITLTVTSNVTVNTMVTVAQSMATIPVQFYGDYLVGTNSGTAITFVGTPLDTRAFPSSGEDVTSWTGTSEIAWMQGNALTWTAAANTYEYYICAKRPGDSSYHVIGVSDPSDLDTSYNVTQFEDWGATYNGDANQNFPYYITNAICTGTGINDPLTGTIVSGGGQTGAGPVSFTMSANAQNNSSSYYILHDDGPNLKNASNSVAGSVTISAGTVYIPPIVPTSTQRSFVINSYTVLPTKLKIAEAGNLLVAEPLVFPGSITWDGSWSQNGTSQFATTGAANVTIPFVGGSVVLQKTGNFVTHLNLIANTQASTLVFADNFDGELDHVNFGGFQSNNDTLGVNLLDRDNTNTIDDLFIKDSLFDGGPNQVADASWTPLAMVMGPNPGNLGVWVYMERTNWNRRGWAVIGQGNCGQFDSHWAYRQGGITPWLTVWNCGQNGGPFILDRPSEDTSGQPRIFNLTRSPGGGGLFQLNGLVGGAAPATQTITGFKPLVLTDSNDASYDANPNRMGNYCSENFYTVVASPYETGSGNPAPELICRLRAPVAVESGYPMFASLLPPTSITSNAPTAGGSIPNGTYVWNVTSVDPRGGETRLGGPNTASQTTGSGNNTEALTWTLATGAVSYNVYRASTGANCAGAGPIIGCGWYRVNGSPVTGTSFTDTSAATSGTAPSVVTAGGANGFDQSGFWGTQLLVSGIKDGLVPASPTTAASCTLGTASAGCAGSFVTGYSFNQNATAATAVTYTLPTAQAGRQYCVSNSFNGSAANTGVLTIATSATGQFIIFTDGTLSATGGNVTSGGAAADAACVVGVDSTHWQLFVQQGTWTKH